MADVSRPKVILHCFDNKSEVEQRVCDAMHEALAARSPDHELHHGSAPSAETAAPDAIHLMVDIKKSEKYLVEGCVVWWTLQGDAGARRHRGPTISC